MLTIHNTKADFEQSDHKIPLRVGIIGMGRSGRYLHANQLAKMGEYYLLAAVADGLQERRDHAVQQYGCNAYPTYEEMMRNEQLDLIVNASPSDLHYSISLDLLNRGMHVLCEKPLAKTTEEVDRLIEAAEKSGKHLAIFQQSRYEPSYVQMRKIIDSGILGRIVQIDLMENSFTRRWDWQTLQSYNGGNLFNSGSHILDQALQLFDAAVEPQVTCTMDRANTFGDAEDYVKLLLRGANCPTIDIELSSCAVYPKKQFLIQGTNGGLQGDSQSLEWKYYKAEEAPIQQLIEKPLVDKTGKPAYCSETLIWHEDRWEMSLPPQYQGMYDYMTGQLYLMLHSTLTLGTPLEITPRHIRRQMAIMEECRRQNPHIYG